MNKEKVTLCKNGRAMEVLDKSLGQETGSYDDSVSGVFGQSAILIFENDILLVEFANSIAKRMSLTYDPSVAAYILTDHVSGTRYSFGTIRKMQEQGEILRIKVIGNMYQGVNDNNQNAPRIDFI